MKIKFQKWRLPRIRPVLQPTKRFWTWYHVWSSAWEKIWENRTIMISNIYCTGTKPSLPIVIFSSTIGFKYLISIEHKSSNSSTKGARTLPSDIMCFINRRPNSFSTWTPWIIAFERKVVNLWLESKSLLDSVEFFIFSLHLLDLNLQIIKTMGWILYTQL